jgi:hypothetical protein
LGAAVWQSAQPLLQDVYAQLAPTHAVPRLWTTSQETPQPVQFVTVPSGVSHPLLSGGLASQSAKPALQPEYSHVLPLQPASRLETVSHARPHRVQLDGLFSCVSHPSAFGEVFVQSPQPGVQPE